MINRKRIPCLWGVLLGGWLCAFAQNVIPVPLRMEVGEGAFTLTSKTGLYIGLDETQAAQLQSYLQTWPLSFRKAKKGKTDHVVQLLVDRQAVSSPEGYLLSVTPQRVRITAASDAGLFYGLQTLRQLAVVTADGWTIPSVEVCDAPRFAYRGLMLDVSRHFFPKEFVKRQMEVLATYKMNRMHLHLTDAAGWRLEMKHYPLLTQLAAWRPEARWKTWWFGNRHYCRSTDPGAYGGYYTQEDIRELVAYAQERHITLIPEIEMPAHSEEVLTAYPELSCTGEPYKQADFCVGKEETFTFLENVLTEVMELFPSEYIHIGGDEAGKNSWKTCPLCRERMEYEGLTDVDELQSYLIHRIERFLNNHGRKLIGWDEILDEGLTKETTVMSWRGEEGGLKAVRQGNHTILSPGSHCYLDAYQDAPHTQPEAIGGYLPLEKVYSYHPASQQLSPEEELRIDGVQGNLWTEYVPTPEQAETMLYPRLLAIAEVGWSAPERRDWPDFRRRALVAVEDLREKGYHPFDLKNEVGHRPASRQSTAHLARGKKVVYNAPYHSAYPAKGDSSLTDGLRGDWTYADGAWQGFISTDRLDVTVDLEQLQELHYIAADFMQQAGAEVYLPVEVCISVSMDAENYTELYRKNFPLNRDQSIDFRTDVWQGKAEGRYVRFQARAGNEWGGWVFTDEIVVK